MSIKLSETLRVGLVTATPSGRGLERRSECPAAVPRGLSAWRAESSAQRKHPEGDSPVASPPRVGFLLTSADSRPPPSRGPCGSVSVMASQHSVPSCFPVQRGESDWLSVSDPDQMHTAPSALGPRPLALSPARVAPQWLVLFLPSESPVCHLCHLISQHCWPPQPPSGQSSGFGMASTIPAQVGEAFGIDLTGPREALASPAAAWRG